MNRVAEKILSYYGTADDGPKESLTHYGMPRRSGRYPWGSGDMPFQRSGDFLSRIDDLKKDGMSEKEIADYLGLSTGAYRAQKGLAKDERRMEEAARAKELRDSGMNPYQIAEAMGYKSESSIRFLLDDNVSARRNQSKEVADFLKNQVDEKGMIEVGAGVELELGISKEKMAQALYLLEREGYIAYGAGVPQVTNAGKQTNIKVLVSPDIVPADGKKSPKEIYDFENVHSINEYTSHDGGETFDKYTYPKSIDSKRVAIRYAEDGGELKDGVVELRRGVPDLDLGNSNYAQVRILVDGTHYIKGMAVYNDDIPTGVDMIFNTNKSSSVSKMDVLKPIKDDPDNPFGALIKANGQSYYDDTNGKKQLSAINKTREEGDWDKWTDKLPSQFLGKQNMTLIKKQLNLTYAEKESELDSILSLTNPTVKKVLLKSFSDDCDAAAIHLKAAALPGQKFKVLLPLTTIKDTEVYAPSIPDGTKVSLIRFPHGGLFEIPTLIVNNKNQEGRKIIGSTAIDAVGVSKKIADQLSGADWDGDTVLAIPHKRGLSIESRKPLEQLVGFNNKDSYGADTIKTDSSGNKHYYQNGKEYKIMANTQTEMGKISNLITDMTLKGANWNDISKAVKHSMVVIDAEKHKLNYKKSYIDNDIASLKKKYQGSVDEDGKFHTGAATLLSRAKSPTQIDKRKGSPRINIKGEKDYDPTRPEGALIYKTVKEQYVDKKGKVQTRTQASTRMADTDDAYTLSSGTTQEKAYADYANKMKALANRARKDMVMTGKIKYDQGAKNVYRAEVDDLMTQLNLSLRNAPKERKAQLLANSVVKAKKQDNPDLSKSEVKKISQQALTQARLKVGAKRQKISISNRDWEAIQAGAISETKLLQILNNADMDQVRQRATPRAKSTLSTAQINKIKAMKATGYSIAEIAQDLGKSPSTISSYLK